LRMMRDFIRIRNVNQLEVIMKKSPQLKKTLIKLVLIIAPTLVNFVSSFNKYLQPGGERMMFIGIFENCDTTLKQNQTITDSMLCQKVIDETNLKKHEFLNFAVERGGYEIAYSNQELGRGHVVPPLGHGKEKNSLGRQGRLYQ